MQDKFDVITATDAKQMFLCIQSNYHEHNDKPSVKEKGYISFDLAN